MSLLNFVVLYRTAEMMPIEAPMCFQCWAEDSDHAEEQCCNAYPECDVLWVWQGEDGVGVQAAFDDYWNDLQMVKPDQIVSREFRVTWDIDVPAENHVEAARLALGIQRKQSSIATVFKVSDGTGTVTVDLQEGNIVVVEDVQGLSPQQQLQQLVAEIQEKLNKARALAVEPFSLKLGDTVDVAITPAVGHDDRVMVGREGWGFTLVNYTAEGLVLDVLSNTQTDPVWSGALYHDVLTK